MEKQISEKEVEYETAVRAKRGAELLEIKNALESLKFKIASSPISRWRQPNPDELTIATMIKQLKEKTNKETSKEFKSKFSVEKIQSLAKENLIKARDQKREAKKLFQ